MVDISMHEAEEIDFTIEENDSEEEVAIRNVGANTEEKPVLGAKRRRQESKVKHPLKCRACGKIFTDTANCRRHERNHVCCRSKPSDELKICIGNHFLNLNTHLNNAYDDIVGLMVSVLVYENNKVYLIESSLNLMRRTLCSERLNIIASLKTVEKKEKKNVIGEKQKCTM